MLLDFDERYEDHVPIGGAIRRWDGVLVSVGMHVVIVLAVLLAPPLDIFAVDPSAVTPTPERERERPRFVFVQPRVDLEALKPPPRAEASDKDRVARAPAPTLVPDNPLPFARGNSAERLEASPDQRARGRGPEPEPTNVPTPETIQRPPENLPSQSQVQLPQPKPQTPSGGSLGEALKNLQKYIERESFNNPRGNVQDLGPLQFDTKGVEFGPWIRRFVAQVRRNWFIPYAAMTMRGHVVLTFIVHKNGALTDVQVVQPSSIESFNTAAMNALLASNPTEPLPPEYPDDKAFFTVTFFYNETPGQ